jgi:hypothetical protein
VKLPLSFSAPLLLALVGQALADVPKKAPLSKYSGLYNNSPFTSKPIQEGPGEEENPLDDYALIGVSPIENSGYRVTLINKKKPEERITVDSGKTGTGFTILGVDRKPGDPLGTAVRMKSGSTSGVVKFDEKLLTLAAAPKQAAPQPNIPGQPPQPQLQPDPNQPQPQRQPRPRVVPPPTPQAGQVQQPNVQQNQQRPQRRGN